ncbi:MAG: cytochrome b [Pseudomonadota bacterium]
MTKPLIVLFVTLLPELVLAADAPDLSDRMPGNEESWIALMIVLGSVLAAWTLNHKAPGVRMMGTMLAASGCLATSAWFFYYVLGSGFVSNPKPIDAPFDLAKPALIWIQGLIAFAVGIGLLFVANQQSKSTRELHLDNKNEVHRYGRVSRVLHWTIAILFICMIPMGVYATMIPEGVTYRLEYYVVHKTIGVIIFALVLIRIFWNLHSRRPELDAHLKPIEKKLAHGAHLALYFILLAMPVTGYIMTSYFGAPTYFFAWEIKPLWDISETGVQFWGLLHKYLLPYLIYVILGAHILGALKHQFIDKHVNALNRMVS